jgi:hypothetical protein
MHKMIRAFLTLPTAAGAVSTAAIIAGCSTSAGPSATAGPVATADAPPSQGQSLAAARYQAASVVVPGGGGCLLHPQGVTDPKRTASLRVDADGVARFNALRATAPAATTRLELDCTDSAGKKTTYPVDLMAPETFAQRPFDPARAGLELRPALVGDPLSFTQEELSNKDYGIRPDPVAAPAQYARWLQIATTPMHKLRSVDVHLAPADATAGAAIPVGGADAGPITPNASIDVEPWASAGWTGAILTGSYQPASQQAYAYAQASFTVPSATPATGNTQMSIWSGLDAQVFQAIVWVQVIGSTPTYFLARQCFNCTGGGGNTQGVNFTPNAGDSMQSEVWYCDAAGNINMQGGYECSKIVDFTQNVEWDCTKAGDPTCPSEVIPPTSFHGQYADFVVELDTDEVSGAAYADEWPNFSTITMSTDALVVTGDSSTGTHVNVGTDPAVQVAPDWTTGVPSFVDMSVTSVHTLFGQVGAVTWNAPQKSDLSSIGTGNFAIGFILQSGPTTDTYAVMGQRNVCGHGDFWDIRVVDGHLTVETDDGTNYTALTSSTVVTDNVQRTVLIQRVNEELSISFNGAVDSSATSASSFGFLPPPSTSQVRPVYGCVGVDGTQEFEGSMLSNGFIQFTGESEQQLQER